ncbi:MAG: glycosyltransferase, partial [Bacteroidales bacterium]|nr:glycosyltransferase [Bacteroidales bacterium]
MERVLANKTNALCQDGNDVLIVTTDQRGQDNAFAFDKRIRFVDLGINYEDNNGKSFINKLIHYPFKQLKHRKRLSALLRKEKADIVVSMFCNDASFLPRIKDGSKKVLEIHFSRFKRIQYGRKGIWALADKLRSKNDLKTVSRFDKFIVLTNEDKKYWGDLSNIQVIPNARTFSLDTPSSLDSKTVIAVGRYNFQKDLGKLIDAWSLIDHKDWKLHLVGDGEERPS